MVRAVLLDIDGTLVDSNDAHAWAWVDAFAEHGHSVPFEPVRARIGKGGDKLMPEVSGIEKSSVHGQAIDARRTQIFKQRYMPELRALPGARELLERFRADGLRLVVATSAKSDEMHALLDLCGARSLIDEHTSSDEAERSKPDPDIVRAALDKARVAPHEALMLGDTPYDIEAAARADVRTVALRSGGWDDAELGGALAIYDDPRALLERYLDSPFAAQPRAAAGRG